MGARWTFVVTLLLAAAAVACPVCGAATDNQSEYKVMTLIMSALPLMTMGSIVGLIAYRVRKADRAEAAKLPPPAQ